MDPNTIGRLLPSKHYTHSTLEPLFDRLVWGGSLDSISPSSTSVVILLECWGMIFLVAFQVLLEMVVYIVCILFLVKLYLKDQYVIVKWNYIAIGIIVSSFGKTFLLLMMIWDFDSSITLLLDFFIISSNTLALKGDIHSIVSQVRDRFFLMRFFFSSSASSSSVLLHSISE